MQLLKPLSLLGLLAAFGLSAGAQNASQGSASQGKRAPRAVPGAYTTVDSFGNVIKTTVRPSASVSSPSVVGTIAQQGVNGSAPSSSFKPRAGYNNSYGSYGNGYINGYSNGYSNGYNNGYNNAPNAYYPSPYPYPAVNNYYLPEPPYTIPLPSPEGVPLDFITSIPLGTSTSGVIVATPYPYPGYGYPYTTAGYPPYSIPSHGVPSYGTTIYGGTGYGGVYTQSQSSGFGVSVGRGGVSVRLGNQNSNSSTVVRPF